MKKEQFYELLGDVDESAVKAAEKPPVGKTKNTKNRWIRYAAAAAACVVAVSCVGIGLKIFNSKGGTVLKTASRKKMLLASAEYPEMPAYPDESDYGNDYDAYFDAYEKWWTAWRALRDQPEGYRDGYDVFFSNSSRVFLSGAGSDKGAGAGTENIIYSPLSLYMALGMSAEITDGNTRRQILDALAQDDIETLRSRARSVWQANYMDDGVAKCVLATSLWTNNNIKYNENTVDTLADNYYSSVFTGDPGSEEYNKLLRAWLNEQTDGLLEDHVSGMEMYPDTVLALASTVNYSGTWQDKFSKDNTKQGTFHSPNGDVQCDFMHDTDHTTYFWGEKFSSVSKRLENNGLMRFILPDEGVSPEELLNDEEAIGFMSYAGGVERFENSKYVIVNLSVPKFDVSSRIDLSDGLNELGITDIFDPSKSDFTPLTDSIDNVWLSKAEQDTRVMIDEEGCKGVSITMMLNAGAVPPTDEVDFVLDRPFIFEIVSDTGLPLFVGIVNRP